MDLAGPSSGRMLEATSVKTATALRVKVGQFLTDIVDRH